MAFNASAQVKEAEVSIVVIRADGTKEDLGVVARYSSNPLKQAIYKIKDTLNIKRTPKQ